MALYRRYGITLPGTTGRHGPPTVLVVHLTGDVTAEGRPVYADESGDFRVQISDDFVAQPLADRDCPTGGGGQEQCLHAEPLP
ncbi:DUF6296 family protein [Kitasatospora sp. NPDC056076]|uniref:DUF6296 family protein n=1 Tax=Kitasatospora sp. NPDC056076 TaxID=3345703 RepID=UPI0035E0F808